MWTNMDVMKKIKLASRIAQHLHSSNLACCFLWLTLSGLTALNGTAYAQKTEEATRTPLGEAVPDYYQVNIANPADGLNVRAEPNATANDIGDLASDASPIEVIETSSDSQWARIIWGESSGWVSLNFLKIISPETIGNTQVPVGLQCSGTEPFWDYRINNQMELSFKSSTESAEQILTLDAAVTSANGSAFPSALFAVSNRFELTAVIQPERCDDARSERVFGWQVDLIFRDATDVKLMSGCCFVGFDR